MKSSGPFFTAIAASLIGAAAMAAHVDFHDPKRALGREGDVRVDASLSRDTVSPNSPVNVTYQIENLSNATIAVADRVFDTTFDPDARTITFSIGAEVPPGPSLPHLSVINPGQKRVFTGGAVLHVITPDFRTPWSAVPQYVQIRIIVLRDVTPFAKLIELQSRNAIVPLPKDMFDRWVEYSESVVLNTIPVYWKSEARRGTAENGQPSSGTY